MKPFQVFPVPLGMAIAASWLTACATSMDGQFANAQSPRSDLPAAAAPPPATALVGTWEGQQLGTATTQAIVTFKPDGRTYTLLKTGVDYLALATPLMYTIDGDRSPMAITLHDQQIDQPPQLWGIFERVSAVPLPASPAAPAGNGTIESPLTSTPASFSPERLRLSLVPVSAPQPQTFEPTLTVNLTRRPDTGLNPSANIARQGQVFLETLVERQLAAFIETGQFSDLQLQPINQIASAFYRYEMEHQDRPDRLKLNAIPHRADLPSFTAVVWLNPLPPDAGASSSSSLLTATLCRSSTNSRIPPATPTLQGHEWVCASGSTRP